MWRGKSIVVISVLTWLLASLAPVEAQSTSPRFINGVHYTEFAELEKSSRPQVMEFVSVFCPGCYATETNRSAWARDLPSDLRFAKVHVDFMAGTNRQGFDAINRAMTIHNRHQQRIGNQIVWEIFTNAHERRIRITEENVKLAIGKASQSAGADLLDEYESFAVRSAANRAQQLQKEMRRIGVVRGVPTFLINNRYRINLDQLDQNNYFAELNAIITYLSTKDMK